MPKNIVLGPSIVSKKSKIGEKKALHRHFKSHLSFTINMNMCQHETLFVSGFTALKIKTRDTVILPAHT